MTGDPHMQPLRTDRGPLYLRQADGQRPRLTLHRLDTEPSTADETLLKRCTGPVLDIGCGPGRLTQALTRRGVVTLGIDIAPCAVARTLAVGAAALRRSVFDPLPNEGDWQTLVLADGNIGIGGDPQALLRRCVQLAAPDGVLLIEVDRRDGDERCIAWVEDTRGHRGPPFPWARVGASTVRRAADLLGLRLDDQWVSGRRRFLSLIRNRVR
ncbi:class I SAM-dependent methyltransferase [Kitasatospora cystarginea]|uniref:Class I SAM-dependent methyltransferase n=1 Tax=Kitasatospora cystarginea TaxID=58350 RepID=A0ABP5QMH9_9ACTN